MEPTTELETVTPVVTKSVDEMTDRELLEYIALNMLTPDSVYALIEARLPELLAKYGDHPLIKTVGRFLF